MPIQKIGDGEPSLVAEGDAEPAARTGTGDRLTVTLKQWGDTMAVETANRKSRWLIDANGTMRPGDVNVVAAGKVHRPLCFIVLTRWPNLTWKPTKKPVTCGFVRTAVNG